MCTQMSDSKTQTHTTTSLVTVGPAKTIFALCGNKVFLVGYEKYGTLSIYIEPFLTCRAYIRLFQCIVILVLKDFTILSNKEIN